MPGDTTSRLNKSTAAVLAIAGIAALAVWLVWTGTVAGGRRECEVCHRALHRELAFEISTKKGPERTCCPRCGLVAILQNGGRAVNAVDFVSNKPVDAMAAVYLQGSDIVECCPDMGFRTSEGAYRDMTYDRCLPSLLAFRLRSDAEKIQREHGGDIVNFVQARESVARQLKFTN